MRKRRGPKTLSWGTPQTIALLSDVALFISTHWYLPGGQDLNQFSGKPRMPQYFDFSRMSWLIVSNAFAKSEKMEHDFSVFNCFYEISV